MKTSPDIAEGMGRARPKYAHFKEKDDQMKIYSRVKSSKTFSKKAVKTMAWKPPGPKSDNRRACINKSASWVSPKWVKNFERREKERKKTERQC